MPSRRSVFGLLPLALAACAREAPPVALPSFRDEGVPIASTLRGSAADLAGDWVIAESYPGRPFAAPGTRVTVEPGAGGVAWRLDGPGGAVAHETVNAVPGRYESRAESGPEFWVLWVDDDFRTAAVGSPDGTFGWIMDRPGRASPDRTVAAREVLDFNGYDVARLVGGP